MNLSSNTDAGFRTVSISAPIQLLNFPTDSIFASTEQKRRFELLRLAFFVLKLRKLNQHTIYEESVPSEQDREMAFRRNLMHHVIFQQIVTLTRLEAREQAMQIIAACHKA